MEEATAFINRETGEIVVVTDDEMSLAEEESEADLPD